MCAVRVYRVWEPASRAEFSNRRKGARDTLANGLKFQSVRNGKTSRFGERPRTTSLGVQHKHTHTHTKQQLPSRTVVGPDTCLGYSTQGEQTTSIVKFSFVVIVIVLYCGLGATLVIPLWNRHGVFEFGREWGRVSKFVPEARAFTGRFESSYLGLSLRRVTSPVFVLRIPCRIPVCGLAPTSESRGRGFGNWFRFPQ